MLDHAWLGAVTTTGAVVVARTSGNASLRLIVSLQSNLSSPSYGATVAITTDKDRTGKLASPTLVADTEYWWGIEIDGTPGAALGRFRTAPAGEASYSFAIGHCAGNSGAEFIDPLYPATSNAPTFDVIRTKQPAFMIHGGDFHYRDINSTNISLYYDAFRHVLSNSRQRDLYRNVPLAYVYDDHDHCGNNSHGASTGSATVRAAFQDYVPHYPLPVTGTIAQTFVWGRVRYVMLDIRSARNNDGSTMLGAAQKQWLKDTLLAATEPVIVLTVGVPWIASSSPGADDWGGYAAEREELANFFEANNLTSRLFIYHGDAHSIAGDSGINSQYAAGSSNLGPPVFCSGPLDCTNSTKGGTYSLGKISASRQQYGMIEVADVGYAITLTARAYSLDCTDPANPVETQQMVLSKQYTADGEPPPVTGPPAYVAARAVYTTATTSLNHTVTLTDPTDIAVGNHLVARVSIPSSQQYVGSVTDPRGNLWQSDNRTAVAATTTLTLQALSCRVETPYQAGDQLVFNITGGATARLIIVLIDELQGIRSVDWVGGTSGWGDTSGAVSTFDSGAIDTTGACIQWGTLCHATTTVTTITPHAEAGSPTAWTELSYSIGAGGTVRPLGGHYRIVEGAETGIAYDGTLSAARYCGASIVEYKGGSVAPPAPDGPPVSHGIWISKAELDAIPASGAAWMNMRAAADTADWGPASIVEITGQHHTRTMAAALVFARLKPANGDYSSVAEPYRTRVVEALQAVMATGFDPGGTNSVTGPCRTLGGYAVAADLINLDLHNPTLAASLKVWLMQAATYVYTGGAAPRIVRQRALVDGGNGGTMALWSYACLMAYVENTTDVAEITTNWRRILGELNVTPTQALTWSDDAGFWSWNVSGTDPAGWAAVQLRGATKDGHRFDGLLPIEMRRDSDGGSTNLYDPATFPGTRQSNYPWVALQGLIPAVEVLRRMGVEARPWGDNAAYRAAYALKWLGENYAGLGWEYWSSTGNRDMVPLINFLYGESWTEYAPGPPAHNIGWTDWTHSGRAAPALPDDYQSSLVASVISSTAETLTGSTVPADLVAALRDKTTATGVKLPDGTHKFALDAFLVQTAAGHEIRYAYMVPTGRSLLVEVWEGALVVADWTHGPTALATAVHDASALNVAGGAYELWLTVT
jgi:hypothetical protein